MKKKIRIKKSENDENWYKDQIGEVFLVLKEQTIKGKSVYIVHTGDIMNSFVNKDDCELIKNLNSKK